VGRRVLLYIVTIVGSVVDGPAACEWVVCFRNRFSGSRPRIQSFKDL